MTAKKRDFKHYGKIRHPARRIAAKIALFIGITFLFTTIVTSIFLDSFSLGSTSMEPTLTQGDKVLSTPLVFGAKVPFTTHRFPRAREPERGELVVCAPPFAENSTLQRLFEPFISFFTLRRVKTGSGRDTSWESTAFVKRVIAIPGDTVAMENFVAFVKPAGTPVFINERELNNREYSITLTPLPENWTNEHPFSGTSDPLTLGENEYFVLGDNRSQSHDSRHFGPIPIGNILQKVLFRYFPLRKAGAT
jgi:signal peptidase I